jgi:predicted GIY-YIG superfamily endonuclease
MPTPKARVKRSASRGLTRTWKKCLLILLVALLLIPAMQVAVVRFIRVKSFASRGLTNLLYYRVLCVRDSVRKRRRLLHWLLKQPARAVEAASRKRELCYISSRSVELIYYEAYLNQEDALGRERYLKSGSGRRFLKAQLKHYLLQEPLARPRRPAG